MPPGRRRRSSRSVTATRSSSGTGCPTASATCSAPGSRRCSLVHPEGLDRYATVVASALTSSGIARAPRRGARQRVGQGRHGRGAAVGRSWASWRSPAPTPSSPSGVARSPTSPASSPRRGCAASGSCRCRRRCSRWSTRPSAARRGSTPPRARTSSAPSTSRPGCCATSTSWRPCPRADLVAGLAEVVKAGFIADPRILELVEADPAGAAAGTARTRASSSSGRSGSRPRSSPPTSSESWLREILNYGHTFGHAVEQVESLPPPPR